MKCPWQPSVTPWTRRVELGSLRHLVSVVRSDLDAKWLARSPVLVSVLVRGLGSMVQVSSSFGNIRSAKSLTQTMVLLVFGSDWTGKWGPLFSAMILLALLLRT